MSIKSIPIFTIAVLLTSFSSAQTAEQVLEKYYDSIGELKFLSYKINNVDTFLTGTVWNTTGYCILKRDKNEPLFGFLFKGKRDDVDEELIFYVKEFYEISHNTKTYKIDNTQIHRGILGHPGGQMVLRELVERIEGYDKISLNKTDSSFILSFYFPDNKEFLIENRYKELHIDNKSYLPFYRYHSLENLGSKQVNKAYLSEMKVNSLDSIDPFISKDFLNDYTYIIPAETENELNKLLNNKAPDFELTNIDGQNHSLSSQKGKVILLDFWEIWCGPCIASIDKLKAISEEYSRKDFEIWSIVSDESSFKKVKLLVKMRGIDYQVFFGNDKTSKDYFRRGVPVYVIIDKEGIIRYAKAGFSSEIEKQIRKHLN